MRIPSNEVVLVAGHDKSRDERSQKRFKKTKPGNSQTYFLHCKILQTSSNKKWGRSAAAA
eukprot:scaffold247_cov274-Pinguiococcus_pyrenoidosus.AAC.25